MKGKKGQRFGEKKQIKANIIRPCSSGLIEKRGKMPTACRSYKGKKKGKRSTERGSDAHRGKEGKKRKRNLRLTGEPREERKKKRERGGKLRGLNRVALSYPEKRERKRKISHLLYKGRKKIQTSAVWLLR